MTTHTAEALEDHQQPAAGKVQKKGGRVRMRLFAVALLAAGAMGVAGTLICQKVTAPSTSAVDAQAAEFADDLRHDLTAGFLHPGQTFGGQFTQGTLVAQVEGHGGVLLSAGTAQGRHGGGANTATVMLGLVPPGKETVDKKAYPVRCYRYTFDVGAYSVKQSATTCPALRTDGRAGSLAAQMGTFLTRQLTGPYAYRQMTAAGYAHTPEGAMRFLKERRLVTAEDAVSIGSGAEDGTGAYAVALRINGVCSYLRMDSSPFASGLIPLWNAPAEEQRTCDAKHATAAAALHGINPAQEG